MKIEFEIDEEKIKELAQTTSLEDLPRAIYHQARAYAVEVAVNQLKNDSLIQDTYYSGGKERLANHFAEILMSKTSDLIKEVVDKQLNEERIRRLVDRHSETVISEWVEKKIYEKLEKAKADIFIGSYGELKAEQESMEKGYQEEIDRLSQQQ